MSSNNSRILISFLLLATVSACKKGNQDTERLLSSISTQSEKFGLDNFSYIVVQNDEILDERYSDEGNFHFNKDVQSVIENYSAPLYLDKLLQANIVNEDLPLSKILTEIADTLLVPQQLISIPANLCDPNLTSAANIPKLIDRFASRTMKPPNSVTIADYKDHDLKLSASPTLHTFFENLKRLSSYFDNNYPFFLNRDTVIHLTNYQSINKNILTFYGWRIFRIQEHTVLWNCFNIAGKELFVIKCLDKNIFAAFLYNVHSSRNNIPLANKDILESPIALMVLAQVYLPKDIYQNLNGNVENFRDKKQWISKSPYRIIIAKEIAAEIKLNIVLGQTEQVKKLTAIFKSLYSDQQLAKYINSSPIAEITNVSNNLDQVVPFSLSKKTEIQIFAGGQVLKVNDYNSTPYNYDNVQLFFNSEADSILTKSADTRLIEFNYRFDKIRIKENMDAQEKWVSNVGIEYQFSDPSRSEYILEVKIPWHAIGRNYNDRKKEMKMNILIGDSDLDENSRSGILSWTVKSNEWFNDPHSFGSIFFDARGKRSSRKNINCFKAGFAPQIDGLIDTIWNQIPFEELNTPYYGNVNKLTIAAKFKMVYDESGIYILFDINDNCKNLTGFITKDKCWIEDASNNNIQWKMNGRIYSQYPSTYQSDKIVLEPGKYNLKYKSDAAHSFEGWYGPIPENDIYGIQLYESK